MGQEIDAKRINFLPAGKVKLDRFNCGERILDIGGGGEGIIARLFGEKVVAIDLSREELQEATANGALRIEMDATELKFLDEEFPTVTSFFSLMYMTPEDQKKVFTEASRVLQKGGNLLIWDTEITPHAGGEKDVIALELSIELEGEEIKTGYGVYWPGKEQSAETLAKLGEEIGFSVRKQEKDGSIFFIKLEK